VRWLFPGKEIRIDSRCLDCGEPTMVRMRDDLILEIDPPEMVGYMTSPFSKWREGSGAFN